MLALLAIFKNESGILHEWLQHYINEGVDHFFLINNGSTDNFKPIIKKYKKYISIVHDDKKYSQIELYNKYFLNKSKKYEWLIICDLDEFIYSRHPYKTIKTYLKSISHAKVNIVKIPWKMFGSSGYIKQPQNVIHHFIKRNKLNLNKIAYIECKSIVRTKDLKKIMLHDHHMIHKKAITSDNLPIKYDKPNFAKINENILMNSYLHLNHYAIQSYNWFKQVKMNRGDATAKNKNSIRNDAYFQKYDFNESLDPELKNKAYFPLIEKFVSSSQTNYISTYIIYFILLVIGLIFYR